ncbi:hypothetical protein OROHE_017555 [Orobanche hederae]
MYASGSSKSKRNLQSLVNDDLDEDKILRFEKAIKDAKVSVEKAERYAILLTRAIECDRVLKRNHDLGVEDDNLPLPSASINPAATEVEENAFVVDRGVDDAITAMLKIMLPQLFEKK